MSKPPENSSIEETIFAFLNELALLARKNGPLIHILIQTKCILMKRLVAGILLLPWDDLKITRCNEKDGYPFNRFFPEQNFCSLLNDIIYGPNNPGLRAFSTLDREHECRRRIEEVCVVEVEISSANDKEVVGKTSVWKVHERSSLVANPLLEEFWYQTSPAIVSLIAHSNERLLCPEESIRIFAICVFSSKANFSG